MDLRDVREFLLDSIKVILTVFVIFFIMFYVFSITQVVGNSMNPTLENGQVLIVDKIKYRFFDIKRGDIISLQHGDAKFYIKRVIGLPGEEVHIKDNKVYVNGALLTEDYLPDDIVYNDFDLTSLGYTTIPEGMYFVLGDNRANSSDSREIGLISKSDIVGRIDMRLWPMTKFTIFK